MTNILENLRIFQELHWEHSYELRGVYLKTFLNLFLKKIFVNPAPEPLTLRINHNYSRTMLKSFDLLRRSILLFCSDLWTYLMDDKMRGNQGTKISFRWALGIGSSAPEKKAVGKPIRFVSKSQSGCVNWIKWFIEKIWLKQKILYFLTGHHFFTWNIYCKLSPTFAF